MSFRSSASKALRCYRYERSEVSATPTVLYSIGGTTTFNDSNASASGHTVVKMPAVIDADDDKYAKKPNTDRQSRFSHTYVNALVLVFSFVWCCPLQFHACISTRLCTATWLCGLRSREPCKMKFNSKMSPLAMLITHLIPRYAHRSQHVFPVIFNGVEYGINFRYCVGEVPVLGRFFFLLL